MSHVVYVHGLWLPGEESLLLRHRLTQDFSLTLHSLRYSAVLSGIDAITARLDQLVRGLAAPEVHFIGHSLGGLIVYRYFERFPQQAPGRVVFLGVPAVGSRAAERAMRFAPVAHLMGQSVIDELLFAGARRWSHPQQLGLIAGTQPLGVGQLLARFEEDNDGTVAVSETSIAGATDQIALPVSHLGMLVSPRVAHETGLFLTQGRFSLR